jgi:CheY-like chemotaxis protein
VEDYHDGADSMAVLVELQGHQARVARTGEEGLRLAREAAPDVVLLDIGLPDADGYAVAERLRAVPQRRPLVVVVTGFMNIEWRSRAAGIDHHFVKPVNPGVLERLLGRHAEKLAAYERLIRAARERTTISYAELAKAAGRTLGDDQDLRELGSILDEIAEEEVAAGRPLLGAVVVRGNNMPGAGLFRFARQKGLQKTADLTFFVTELNRVYAYWAAPAGERPPSA